MNEEKALRVIKALFLRTMANNGTTGDEAEAEWQRNEAALKHEIATSAPTREYFGLPPVSSQNEVSFSESRPMKARQLIERLMPAPAPVAPPKPLAPPRPSPNQPRPTPTPTPTPAPAPRTPKYDPFKRPDIQPGTEPVPKAQSKAMRLILGR